MCDKPNAKNLNSGNYIASVRLCQSIRVVISTYKTSIQAMSNYFKFFMSASCASIISQPIDLTNSISTDF